MSSPPLREVPAPAQPGLYIGGLRNDFHPAKLAGLICNLLWKFQVQVPKQWVHINFKSSEAYAIIDLDDISVSQYLLTQLSYHGNVHNAFDLTKITFDPTHFKVGPKLTTSNRHRSRSRPNWKNSVSADRSAVGSEPNAAQHYRFDNSTDRNGRFRSRSGSNRRNSSGRRSDAAGSNTLLVSTSNHSVDGVGTSKKSRRRGRKKNRTGFDREANASHEANTHHHCSSDRAAHLNCSNSSQNSRTSVNSATLPGKDDSDGRLSDSGTDSSPASRDASSSSVLSRDSENQVDTSKVSVFQPRLLQAGGVRRLVMEEFSGGGVSGVVPRSLSERGIHSSAVSKTSTTTSTTGLPLPSQVSVTTSTPGTGTCLASNFYRLGQTIGRETRHSEFKLGGKAHNRAWLTETVGKYVCGFLNSAEGGTLYIGVDDTGIATGITCPQSKEDEYRLMIDDALKSIDPPIFTDVYSVHFFPLMEPSGHISDSLQVLEVRVKEIRKLTDLYAFRNKAFLRRDGSLQGPLNPRQVQEWMKKRLERDNSSSLLKSQLREMTSQLEMEREQKIRMQQQLRELEGHLSEVKLERRKSSRICTVM